MKQGDTHAVLAEFTVVVEQFIQGPGDVHTLVVEGVVGARTVEALLGHIDALVEETEVRTEVDAQAQALEGSPHLTEVQLGIEGTDGAEGLAEILLEIPLTIHVLDAVVAARELDTVAVIVERNSIRIALGGNTVSGALGAALEVTGTGQTVVLDAVGGVDAGAEGEPLVGLEVIGGLGGKALEILSVDGTLVREVTEGHIGLELVGTSGSGDGVLVGDGRLEDQAHPVGGLDVVAVPGAAGPALHDVAPGIRVATAVEDLVVVVLGRSAGARIVLGIQVVVSRTTPVDVLAGGHPGALVLDDLVGEGAGVADMHLALGTLLGGHEDDTVGAAGTVDGGRGGVLQDLDGLDILRVEVLDRAAHHRNAVHDIQRRRGGGEGALTADIHGTDFTRALVGADIHTGGAALQGFEDVVGRTLGQLLGADGNHGARHIALLHRTVTDGHGLFEEQAVILQGDGHVGGRVHPFGNVADAGDLEGRAGSDAEFEVTVDVRDHTRGGAGDVNGSSDDRFALGIQDFALAEALCESSRTGKDQSHDGRKRHQRFTAQREIRVHQALNFGYYKKGFDGQSKLRKDTKFL